MAKKSELRNVFRNFGREEFQITVIIITVLWLVGGIILVWQINFNFLYYMGLLMFGTLVATFLGYLSKKE